MVQTFNYVRCSGNACVFLARPTKKHIFKNHASELGASTCRHNMYQLILATAALLASFTGTTFAQDAEENSIADAFFNAKTAVFLGDSITYQGEFLTSLESTLRANGKSIPRILNLGLSSETCSGDSEPAHPWPRPNVHERFQRMLEKVQPDLLVVNYGMNDGIYHPFNEKRFANYQAGINKIIEAAEKSEGKLKVILVTPPPFDAVPVKAKGNLVGKDAQEFSWKKVYENYDAEVLAVYSEWILAQKDRVAGCIDLRTPILNDLAEKRKTNPNFQYAPDGVHLNSAGHQLIGDSLARALDVDPSKKLDEKLQKMVRNRQLILRDCWLKEVGHKRPNVKEGLSVELATKLADRTDEILADAIQKQNETKTNK